MGKSLRYFLFIKKMQWYQHFLIKNMPRNLGFYDRKMKWTFLFIFVQVHSISELSSVQVPSAKKWTEFSSKFTKKVNFWTELNFSVQFSHFLDPNNLIPQNEIDAQWIESTGSRRLLKPKSNVPLNKLYIFTELRKSFFLQI